MLGLFQSDKFLVMLETLFLPSYSFSRAMSSLSSQNGGGRACFTLYATFARRRWKIHGVIYHVANQVHDDFAWSAFDYVLIECISWFASYMF